MRTVMPIPQGSDPWAEQGHVSFFFFFFISYSKRRAAKMTDRIKRRQTEQVKVNSLRRVAASCCVSMVLRSVFSRPGPVPIQTPRSVPSPDLTALPPSPRCHTRPQLHPNSEEKSEQRLRRALIPLSDNSEDLHVHLLWAKKTGLCALLPCHPVALSSQRRETRGLDRVYICSWEVSFPLGQCEDMSVWWQVMIRGSVCVFVWGMWRVMGTRAANPVPPPFF